ncbi:GMC family oxidoreductase [Terrabacter carboxydivorans]|uniref:Glucose-methanol-choline oxidoreductase N-terminal domain-containing protein n=1 Tax=Terrabacter carboxydivorans TaxID=619730 RepID=A0ABN3M5N1_9MICO
MGSTYDYVIVGAGSAGAVVAARLSEDPEVRVCLLEAGGPPPPAELVPAAVASLQNNPATDWMFNGDPGGVGKGLVGGQMMVPRGKMLGGSSGLNYMAYVRGHPGDFDAWAAGGAEGWSYSEVLPYFLKAEGFVDSPELHPDREQHGHNGPVGVSVRQPILRASNQFVEAAGATGLKQGDYNGRDRLEPEGVASLFQTTTKDGRRTSTFHAYIEPAMDRENLTVVTGALVERILLDADGEAVRATGVAYRTEDGTHEEVTAGTEVVLCAGAIGSPHILLLSGVGARDELAAAGVDCVVDLPDVGRHLKDHLHTPLMYAADGIGETMTEVAMSLGPDALRAPAGPLPADPADDVDLPEPLAAAKARGRATHRRVVHHRPRARSVLALRRRRFLLDRARRRAHPRRADRLPRDRLHAADLGGRLPAPAVGVLRGPGVVPRPDPRPGRRAAQSRAAPLGGLGEVGECGPGRPTQDRPQLLRRPARRESHDRRHAPGARDREGLARRWPR